MRPVRGVLVLRVLVEGRARREEREHGVEVLATLLRRLRRGAEPGVLRHLFFPAGGLLFPRGAFMSPRGPARRVALAFFVSRAPDLVGAAPAMQRDRAGPGRVYEFRPVLSEVPPCLRVALAGVRVLFCASQTGRKTNVKSGSQRSAR